MISVSLPIPNLILSYHQYRQKDSYDSNQYELQYLSIQYKNLTRNT
jgi:hypothetical protein